MNNEQQYYEVIAPLIEAGLVREVFSSENVSILNLADAWYMVNLREKTAEKSDYIAGFLSNSAVLRVISEDEMNYNMVVEKLGDDIELVIINEKFVSALKMAKELTLKDGPSELISHELEKKLANKNKRGESKPEESIFSKIFKKKR